MIKNFLNKLYNNKKLFYYFLLFFIWLLLGIIFFGRDGFLFFGDFNPAFSKSQYLYAWAPGVMGYDYSSYLAPFPYWFLSHSFISIFGLNIGTKLSFLLPLLYFSSVIYWILFYCGLKVKNCFVLSVFSLINPLTIGYILNGGVDVAFMGFSNIILAFFFFYLALNRSRAVLNKYLILSVVFASAVSHVVYFFMFLVLLIVFIAVEFVFTKNKIRLFKSAFLYVLLVIIINFYWLTLFTNSILFQHGQEVVLPGNSGVSVLNSLAPFTKILNTISLYYYDGLQGRLHFGMFLDVSLIILVVIIIYRLFFKKNFPLKKYSGEHKITLLILMIFLVSIFFATGPNAPFGNLFLWLFNNISLFQGFRTFMRFNIVIFICYIAFLALIFNRNKNKGKTETFLIIFLTILILYFGQHLIYLKNYKIYPVQLPSPYYKLLENVSKLDSNSVDAPFFTYNGDYTWGATSLAAYLFERSFWYGYLGYVKGDSINYYLISLYNNSDNPKYFNNQYFNSLNGIANIKNIIIHKDEIFNNKKVGDIFSLESIKNNFSNKPVKLIDDNDNFFHFVVTSAYYLPHFYTPKSIVLFPDSISKISNVISSQNYGLRSVIYFQDQSKDKQVAYKQPTLLPVIEFKKINPTKYRVIIHHATDNFPLVFSESFNDSWKTYLVNDKKTALNFNSADYKILDGNGDDQANTEELTNFINSGYISTLGNFKEKNIKHVKWENNKEVFDYNEKYKIDFISKNFQDTIQNDNLAPGSFYETWFKKPVADNQNHLMVNGYANSWNINPTELCGAPAGQVLCVRNADGSYDLELVVEFWPQRLFYIGLFISGATLFGCLGYLGWDFVRRKKRKGKKGEKGADVEGEIKEN